MVAGKRVEPGPELRNLFSSCGGEEVEAAVRSRIQGLADLFTARYTAPTETHPGSQVPARTFAPLIIGLLTKRCLTNGKNAFVYEPSCGGKGGSCGVSANEYSPSKLWISNSMFNLRL